MEKRQDRHGRQESDEQDTEQARRWWRKRRMKEEGEGTRAGLSPLTTGPGLPSNP